MADDPSTNPADGFAALMSGAATQATPEAPFGYTRDRETGEMRPKKTAGRPKQPPSLDELRTSAAPQPGAAPAAGPAEDRPPSGGGRKRGKKDALPSPAGEEPIPQHRPGVITKGVNRMYRRAGKIVRAMDRDIGIAIIESTKNTADDGEPDDSVGAAWDEMARTNPRIRRFLLKILAGGAWGQLFMAHLPILMAVIMKDGIRKHIPLMKFITAMTEKDGDDDGEEGQGGISGLLAGMEPGDMQQMMKMAQAFMGKAAMEAA